MSMTYGMLEDSPVLWAKYDLPNGETFWAPQPPSLKPPYGNRYVVRYGGYTIRLITQNDVGLQTWEMAGRCAHNIVTHINEVIHQYNTLLSACQVIESERNLR